MKNKKKMKFIIPAVIIVILIAIGLNSQRGAMPSYLEEVAEVRDIITYRSFTGNIEAKNNMSVTPVVSATVSKVLISDGDDVKAGDVIAELDGSSVEQEIALKEANIDESELSSYYSAKEAQKSYDDYKGGLDKGLNSNLNQAKSQKSAAKISLKSAKQNYSDNEEEIKSAKTGMDDAKNDLSKAKTAYQNQRAAVEAMNNTEANYAAESSELATLKTETQTKQQTYDAALSNHKKLKGQRSSLQAAVDSAQNTYDSAVSTYNGTNLTTNQTLESYEDALEKTKALSSTDSTTLELDNLYSKLEDYKIIAPMDGTITDLDLTKGEMVTANQGVASVTDFSGMEISIKIDEYDIQGVETGKDVDITVDALGEAYTGTIDSISKTATVENGVSYFTGKISYDADEYIRSGLSVEVKLKNNDIQDVVTISMDALNYEDDNTAYVLVKDEDGKEKKQYVTLGITEGTYVEIKEGLSKGDIVLVAPTTAALPGMMGRMPADQTGATGGQGGTNADSQQ